MTTFVIDTSVTTNLSLGLGDSGVVTSTGTIASFGFEPAIDMVDANFLTINGTVTSGFNRAIRCVSDPSAAITIGTTGFVSGGGTAIDLKVVDSIILSNAGTISSSFTAIQTTLTAGDFDANFYLTNTGTITSLESSAVGAFVGGGLARIFNSGAISGERDTIFVSAGEGNSGVSITNSGTITATSVGHDAIAVLGGTLTTIKNTGTIFGDIAVSGVSLHLTNTGSIVGNIFGADLSDTFNLIGGTLSGTVSGGLGNDTYYVSDVTTRITELSFQGNDTVYSTVSWTLARGLENLYLIGSAAIDANGNGTANELAGNDADNTLRGRSGDDTLDGGAGEDTLIGGVGNDTYFYDPEDTIIENALGGTDTIVMIQVLAIPAIVLQANIENLEASASSVNLTITGNAANNSITTSAGNDTLNGLTGSDTLDGATGNDTYITDGGDVIIDADGFDTVQSSVNYTLGTDLERLVLTGTAINGTGNSLANTITGNGSANSLNGLLGSDTLTGGAGADNFIFTTALGASNIDRITDFNAPADTIRIDNAVFTGLTAGALAATAFVQNITGKAADASDRIIYDSKTGALLFDADGTGAQTAVQFATLNTGLGLTAADFFVI